MESASPQLKSMASAILRSGQKRKADWETKAPRRKYKYARSAGYRPDPRSVTSMSEDDANIYVGPEDLRDPSWDPIFNVRPPPRKSQKGIRKGPQTRPMRKSIYSRRSPGVKLHYPGGLSPEQALIAFRQFYAGQPRRAFVDWVRKRTGEKRLTTSFKYAARPDLYDYPGVDDGYYHRVKRASGNGYTKRGTTKRAFKGIFM